MRDDYRTTKQLGFLKCLKIDPCGEFSNVVCSLDDVGEI